MDELEQLIDARTSEALRELGRAMERAREDMERRFAFIRRSNGQRFRHVKQRFLRSGA